jgi:hypothetical protein
MKPPLPRTLSAVPQTLHTRIEIAKAIRALAGPDQDELLQRRAEIAAIRHELEALPGEIRKAGEEWLVLAKAELRAALKKYNPDQPGVPLGNPDGGQSTREAQTSKVSGRITTSIFWKTLRETNIRFIPRTIVIGGIGTNRTATITIRGDGLPIR